MATDARGYPPRKPALTGLVVVVDFDHGRFQVPDGELLLQHHHQGLHLALLQLQRQKLRL